MNRARWGNTTVRAAVETLSERGAELDDALRAELLDIAASRPDSDDYERAGR